MNYYPFHIGDYASKTRHLSWDEDAAYRRLLDAYYTREEPLPLELRAVYRLVLAQTPEQREAVETVLREFFIETPDGWRHGRCDDEIEAMRDKREKASQSGKASARARALNAAANVRSTVVDSASNERSETANEGSTPNTNTNTNTKEERKARAARKPPPRPEDVEQGTWDDFNALRRAKSAPVTATVVSEARKEAAKAAMSMEAFLRVWCSRGSQGLQAEWLKPSERQQGPPAETAYQRSMRERVEQFAPGVAAKAPGAQPTAEVIDVTARRVG